MPADLLTVRDLAVAYGSREVLTGVDLRVGRGEVVALLGPSGSGKSTLLHTVAGFVSPAGGEIWLADQLAAAPGRSLPPEQRRIGFVFQQYGLWPHLSARDTVAYPARRRGVGRAEARREAADLLGRLGIGHLAARRPGELSGGEQQRVGLARALASRASLYLFDEPTAHLDTPLRAAFQREVLTRQREVGAGAIYATHDAEEALGLADRVVLLVDGRIIQTGTPTQLYAEPVSLEAAQLSGPVSVLTGARGRLLVRPDWARLGGERTARLVEVWFRGPSSDYLLETARGSLLVRHPGPPRHRPGEQVRWSLTRSWALPED